MINVGDKLRLLGKIAAPQQNLPTLVHEPREVSVDTYRWKSQARAICRTLRNEKDISARVRYDGHSWALLVNEEDLPAAKLALNELRRDAAHLFRRRSWHFSGEILVLMTISLTVPFALSDGWPPSRFAVQLSGCLAAMVYLLGFIMDLRRRQVEEQRITSRMTIGGLLLAVAVVAVLMGIVQSVYQLTRT